jgi:hypothetical protein
LFNNKDQENVLQELAQLQEKLDLILLEFATGAHAADRHDDGSTRQPGPRLFEKRCPSQFCRYSGPNKVPGKGHAVQYTVRAWAPWGGHSRAHWGGQS